MTHRTEFWSAGTAQSGLQTLALSITSRRTGPSPPFAPGMVFRVIESPPCWKIAPGTCGSGDDGLYLFKNGQFRRVPEPNHQPLGLVVGMTEDIEGNVWAECLSKPPKLVRIR